MIIPSCVAFLPQERKVIFCTTIGYAGGAPDSNNEGILKITGTMTMAVFGSLLQFE